MAGTSAWTLVETAARNATSNLDELDEKDPNLIYFVVANGDFLGPEFAKRRLFMARPLSLLNWGYSTTNSQF